MKYLFLFTFLAVFASCHVQDTAQVVLDLPKLDISTPSVPSGTYTLTKEVSVSAMDSIVKNLSGKTLNEGVDIALTGVTISVLTPESLTFSGFTYATLSVSSGTQIVTVFSNPLSISGRNYAVTGLNSNITALIQHARQTTGMLTYNFTVTTNATTPAASWRIQPTASFSL
jgi:hypothetical protein